MAIRLKNPWPFSSGGTFIRLVRMGCANRPYFQLGVMPRTRRLGLKADEVIGSFDPMPNERNEILVAVDLDRLAYYLGKGARMDEGTRITLGMIGFMPLSPEVYKKAWQNRMAKEEEEKKKQAGNQEHDSTQENPVEDKT